MPVPDYLIVAWAAPAFRRIRLDLGLLTEQRLADCRKVGRGQSITPPALARAMNTATVFWFLTMGSSLLTLLAMLILIGSIFGHQAVRGPINTVVFGLLLGIFTFAASSYGFAVIRAMYLSDALLAGGRPGFNAGLAPRPSPSSATQ